MQQNIKGTIEEKRSHIETPGLVRDQGKTPQEGKPFQILLLIRLSLNVSAKRENNNPIVYTQDYPTKSKQYLKDEPNNNAGQYHDSEACGLLS